MSMSENEGCHPGDRQYKLILDHFECHDWLSYTLSVLEIDRLID